MKKGMPRKLEWIGMNHLDLHYAPVLPLVTPSVIVCLGQVFSQIPNALTEVSDYRLFARSLARLFIR